MSYHHTEHALGLQNRHLRTAAIILAALLVAGMVGIWQTAASIRPLGIVSVGVSPSTKSVMLGDTFTVQVVIDAGANEVQSADVHLKFDPAYVRLTGMPTAGDLPSATFRFENADGTVDIGAYGTSGPATGSIVLCNLTFEALALTTGTPIQLNTSWGDDAVLVVGPGPAYEVYGTTWSDGTVVIGGSVTDTPTPTATNTQVPPTATDTPVPPTATPTNTPGTGTLCITVFYDLNGDGVRQAGEAMLSGAEVRIFGPEGYQAAEFTSDALNQPRCVPLISGREYTVIVTPPPGFDETGPHTSTAMVHGGRAASLDFGETSALGVPTVGAGRLLLPLIIRHVVPEDPFPQTTLDRIGVAVYRSDEPGEAHLAEYPLDRVQFGWYVDWWFQVDQTKPDETVYARVVPVDALYPVDPNNLIWEQIRDQVVLDPGAIWLIGNEPECVHQGNRTPEEYAAIYKVYYDYLKSIDPHCTIGIGGIVQPTALRLEWLDQCLASYQAQFGEPMPVEVWNIHNMVLNEKRDELGAEIPVGLPDSVGQHIQWSQSDDFALFTQQLVDFRTWMAANGYRDLPLFVSEFGVLYPESWFDGLGGQTGEERIKAYMTNTFDYMLNTTDPDIGCPLDGNRLVQRWAYLSLNSPTYEEDPLNHFSGQLCFKSDQTMTVYGLHWEELVSGYVGSGS